MAEVKLPVEIHDNYPNGDLWERRYKVTIITNSLQEEVYILSPVVVPVDDDGSASGAKKLQQLADNELSTEKVAQYQAQNDYDRRALGIAMTFTDVDEFYAVLPLFKGMEGRSGSNANQRAATLEVSRAGYDDMANRFNDVEGIAFFLDDHKEQIWDEIPAEWE